MQPTISIHTGLSTELAKEVEVFPGIHERRFFLGWSLTAAAALLALEGMPKRIFGQTTVKTAFTTGTGALSWEAFLKQAVPVAQQLYADPALNFDEYLYRIGSLATRLNDIPDSKLGQYNAVDPRIWLGPSFRGESPFYIIQWRMEQGAFFPPHNHRNASVCTLGFQGEVRLRNFEILGDTPDYDSKKTFRVKQTREEVMTRGRISTLSPTRDNIHCFGAVKETARGIDINTLHGENTFSFLNMSEKPVDPDNRIFEATWNPQLSQSTRKG